MKRATHYHLVLASVELVPLVGCRFLTLPPRNKRLGCEDRLRERGRHCILVDEQESITAEAFVARLLAVSPHVEPLGLEERGAAYLGVIPPALGCGLTRACPWCCCPRSGHEEALPRLSRAPNASRERSGDEAYTSPLVGARLEGSPRRHRDAPMDVLMRWLTSKECLQGLVLLALYGVSWVPVSVCPRAVWRGRGSRGR